MKKKITKKLELSKETLRNLEMVTGGMEEGENPTLPAPLPSYTCEHSRYATKCGC